MFSPISLLFFFNAVIDIGDKILLQNTIFKIYDGSTQVALTALVNALVILPFVLFFTPAGFLSDRYPKNKILRLTSLLALMISILILGAFYVGMFEVALVLTFLLSFQSALFSPAKYGLIKELFTKEHLTEGNAIVQTVTIVAILLSSLLFSLMFESLLSDFKTTGDIMHQVWPITILFVLLAVVQVILASKVPSVVEGDETLTFDTKRYLRLGYLKENLSLAFSNRVILESIMSLAIFYGVAQVLLAIFGVHLKETLHEQNTVVAQAIMALSGVGIAIGSLLTMRLSREYIETGLLPIGTLGITAMIYLISTSDSRLMLGAAFCFLVFLAVF